MSMWNEDDIYFVGAIVLTVGVVAGCAVGAWESGREYGRREQYKLMLDKLNQKDKDHDRQKETTTR